MNQVEVQGESNIQVKKKRIKKDRVIGGDIGHAGEELMQPMSLTFRGEVAQKIRIFQKEMAQRHSKPDLSQIIGQEILSWTDKRWAELIEENTDVEYFFEQIRKSSDRARSIKLLRSLAEKLKDNSDEASLIHTSGDSETPLENSTLS